MSNMQINALMGFVLFMYVVFQDFDIKTKVILSIGGVISIYLFHLLRKHFTIK